MLIEVETRKVITRRDPETKERIASYLAYKGSQEFLKKRVKTVALQSTLS